MDSYALIEVRIGLNAVNIYIYISSIEQRTKFVCVRVYVCKCVHACECVNVL